MVWSPDEITIGYTDKARTRSVSAREGEEDARGTQKDVAINRPGRLQNARKTMEAQVLAGDRKGWREIVRLNSISVYVSYTKCIPVC